MQKLNRINSNPPVLKKALLYLAVQVNCIRILSYVNIFLLQYSDIYNFPVHAFDKVMEGEEVDEESESEQEVDAEEEMEELEAEEEKVCVHTNGVVYTFLHSWTVYNLSIWNKAWCMLLGIGILSPVWVKGLSYK